MADRAAVEQAFKDFVATFQPDKAQGVSKTLQWNLTGDGGGEWHVVIADGNATLHDGTADSPQMTMTMSADDYMAIADRSLNPQQAFMSGKLKVAGDMMLAMQLGNWFKLS